MAAVGISGVVFIAIYAIMSGTGLLGYLLTTCETVDSVELTESVDLHGVITKKLVKKCITENQNTELPKETAQIIIEKRDKYLKTLSEKEKTSQEIQKLQAEVESLEIRVEEEPDLKPVLVTKMGQLEVTETEFGRIEMRVGSAHVEWMETLDGINILIPSEEQKELVFSELEVLNFPTVEHDQKVYSWGDKVYISIIDPWSNQNSKEIEMIGTDGEIKIRTESGNTLNYSLIETAPDTGFFTGEVILTGFPNLDANNDGQPDASGITKGSGPTDGFLATEQEDGISTSYQFSSNEVAVGRSLIQMNIGEIFFVGQSLYQTNEIATIQVIDPDLNTNPEKIDFVKIKVSSDTTPTGIDVILEETNEATGWFEGAIKLTLEEQPFEKFLRVSPGDEIMVVYFDRTLPKPYKVGDILEIVDVAEVIE